MAFTIVKEGVPVTDIYLPKSASAVEKTAAQELALHLGKISGAVLTVSSECFGKSGIYIGSTEQAQKNGLSTSANEAWMVTVKGGCLFFVGGLAGKGRGVLYSVYHFLEDHLGVHWWTPWDEWIPHLHDIEIPDNFFISGKPLWKDRGVYSINHHKDFLYNARNRLNLINEIVDAGMTPECECYTSTGGVNYVGPPFSVHTLGLYSPAKKYFPQHPDWYAWNEALQQHIEDGQPCFSNEGYFNFLLGEITKNILTTNEKCEKYGLEKPIYYDISFGDTRNFCECAKCKALIESSGIMGYLIHFLNKLNTELLKVDPEVQLETLAYFAYIDPPKDGVKPADNITIRLAHMETDIMHSIEYPGAKRKKSLVDTWSQICKDRDIVLWDYYINQFLNPPLPTVKRIGDDFKYLYSKGFCGCYMENEFHDNMCFPELTQYLLLKLSENPLLDSQKLTDAFMLQFYGPASKPISAYLDLLSHEANRTGFRLKVYESAIEWNYINLDTMRRCIELMDEAQILAADDPVYSRRVLCERVPVDMVLIGKYWDFVRAARLRDETFQYDLSQALERVGKAFREIITHRGYTNTDRYDTIFAYLHKKVHCDEFTPPKPAFLKGSQADVLYDISFKDLSWPSLSYLHPEIVADRDCASGEALRFDYSQLTGGRKAIFTMSSKNGPNPKPVDIILDHKDRRTHTHIYQEDISGQHYTWLHVAQIEDVSEASNTAIWLFRDSLLSVNLSGIASLFEIGDCDVYLSVKATGHAYGGSSADGDALYLDRMVIVRNKH